MARKKKEMSTLGAVIGIIGLVLVLLACVKPDVFHQISKVVGDAYTSIMFK